MFARTAAFVFVTCTFWGCPPDGLNGGVNNLNCPPGSECSWDCNGGVCNIDCDSGSICDVQCNGGVCNFECAPDATCDFECNGGVCNFDCQAGSTCENSGVRPIDDAGTGEGGAGGVGGAGGHGGSDVDLPTTCPQLCTSIDAGNLECIQTALTGFEHDLSTMGCEDLTDPEACIACLQHLQVPDGDCVEAANACL